MHQQTNGRKPSVNRGSKARRDRLRAEAAATCVQLANKLESLQGQVLEPVDEMQDAARTALDAVHTAVDSATGALDQLRDQVEQRPWAMIGGGLAIGAITGWLLSGSRSVQHNGEATASQRSLPQPGMAPTAAPLLDEPMQAVEETEPKEPGFIDREMSKIKTMAVGAGLDAFRGWAVERWPDFARQIDELTDDLRIKVGAGPAENANPPL